MNSRILISTFLLFIAVTGQSPANSKCPANSTFKTCSSMCEPKCGAMIEMMCIEKCGEPKCECNAGFLRDTNGACVLEKDCSTNLERKCPANSTWTDCSSHCEPTCGVKETQACIESCGPSKCQCDSGYMRNLTGACVLKNDCGTNNNQDLICGLDCGEGTHCEWVDLLCFDEPCPIAEACIDDTEIEEKRETIEFGSVPCTAKCSAGQKCVWKQVICVRAPCNPVPTCVDSNEPTGCAAVSCMTGQDCVVDANGNGKCVISGGTRNCPANEFFNECTGCEAMCGQTSPVACPKICISPGRCRCKEGFFRNRISGKCMTQNDCDSQTEPTLSCANVLCMINTTCIETPTGPQCVPIKNGNCSKNEVWDGCGSCEAKCGDEEPVICDRMCRPGKCRCKEGFFRNLNNQCVTKEECSPRITCANVRCASRCIDTPQGPQCIDDEPTGCAAVSCMTGQECVVDANGNGKCALPEGTTDQACNLACVNGFECVLAEPPLCGARCIKTPTCIPKNITSCKMMKCTKDTHCAMVQVECFAPPCYPVPQCVPNKDQPEPEITCANVDCMSGMICQMAEVECFAPPCYPVPQCVPNKDQPVSACAAVDCRPGYKCIEETVNCVMAPCPQQGTHARCVPTQPEITCANVDCMSGMICQMAEVNCTDVFCLPTPQCFAPDNNTTTICERNEIYTDCAPNCEDTCHGIPSCKSEMTAAVCQTGCKCAAGYRRNAIGKCVRKNCYKNPGCGENEEWVKCFGCEKKCGQAADESCSESCRSGCGCVDGFARHPTNGTCVSESEC